MSTQVKVIVSRMTNSVINNCSCKECWSQQNGASLLWNSCKQVWIENFSYIFAQLIHIAYLAGRCPETQVERTLYGDFSAQRLRRISATISHPEIYRPAHNETKDREPKNYLYFSSKFKMLLNFILNIVIRGFTSIIWFSSILSTWLNCDSLTPSLKILHMGSSKIQQTC